MSKPTKAWLIIIIGIFFVVAGAMYLLAALDIVLEDRLSDSAGGPWVQGLGAIALGFTAIGWGIALKVQVQRESRPRKPKTEYQVGIKHQ